MYSLTCLSRQSQKKNGTKKQTLLRGRSASPTNPRHERTLKLSGRHIILVALARNPPTIRGEMETAEVGLVVTFSTVTPLNKIERHGKDITGKLAAKKYVLDPRASKKSRDASTLNEFIPTAERGCVYANQGHVT